MGVSQAKRESNARYDEKTYKTFTFKLRVEDDADIIRSIKESQEQGINKREWIRGLFDNQK